MSLTMYLIVHDKMCELADGFYEGWGKSSFYKNLDAMKIERFAEKNLQRIPIFQVFRPKSDHFAKPSTYM